LPSGAQLIYKNRAGWAHDRLKRAGLSSSSRRGSWKITK
jgi:restriction system protein